MSIGLYIHVPFCEAKCPYCNFYSFVPNDSNMDQFVSSLCTHMHDFLKNHDNTTLDTIYLGGGTPSLLGENRLSAILDFIYKNFTTKSPEITLEINPTRGKGLDFSALRSAGINRLSVGLQSSNDSELNFLGRLHTASDAKTTIQRAQKAGFNNISADLMICLPNQTKENISNSVSFCSSMDIQHVSSYMLKIEPNTPFYTIKDTLPLKGDEESVDLYMYTCKALEDHGFNQYEISNFAKPGFESRHNLKYWDCDEYLGFGPSAHSFFEGERFYFENSFKNFINNSPLVFDCKGGDEEEYIMLKLRLSNGINYKQFKEKFKKTFDNKYIKKAEKYINTGLIVRDKSGIRLTREGFVISNTIIADILF